MSPKAIQVDRITGVWSYLASIDWEEKWLWCLIGFHLLCLGMTLISCKRFNIQAVLFLLYLAVVFFAENINEWAAENWRSFSNQQYFDSNGLFISLVLSVPLLINCFVIVLYWMYTTWNLMIRVKKSQLRHDAKQKQDAQQEKNK